MRCGGCIFLYFDANYTVVVCFIGKMILITKAIKKTVCSDNDTGEKREEKFIENCVYF